MPNRRIWSTVKKKSEAMITMMNTIAVDTVVSFRVGQVTLATSRRTSRKNSAGLVFAMAALAIIPEN